METGKNAKKNGKTVIIVVLAALVVLVLAFLFITGRISPKGRTTVSSTLSEESKSELQQNAVSSTSQPEASENAEVQFGDKLNPFQGEWEIGERSKYHRLIISDDTVNFVSYDNLDKNTVVDNVSTFYFGFDESGDLIVNNQYSQARYILEISDGGQLTVTSLTGGEPETYEKASDNTEVPEITPEPAIGMNWLEVTTSTWGSPKKKNKTTTANGEREQWVYEDGYIYFENGKVTAIQER